MKKKSGQLNKKKAGFFMMRKGIRKFFLVAIVLLVVASPFGCYPVLKKEAVQPGEALREIRFLFPTFGDDMEVNSLVLALRRNFEYLDRLAPETVFRYGSHNFTCRE